MDKLLLFIPQITNRVQYTVDVVFGQLLDVDYFTTSSLVGYQQYTGPKMVYGEHLLVEKALFFQAHPFLFQEIIQPQNLKVNWLDEQTPTFFSVATNGLLSFDPFACIFYMLSRYEEYLPFKADVHVRFPATESLAYKEGFLRLPVVNVWAKMIGEIIQENFAEIRFKRSTYVFEPTYDIDIPWAFKHRGLRGFPRAVLEALLGGEKIKSARWNTWMKKEKDPFDTFDFLDELHQDKAVKPVYFWLLGDINRNKFDSNPSHKTAALQELIIRHASKYTVGIHPSYQASFDSKQLQKECDRLAIITGQKPLFSRQHFLLLRFPETYRALLHVGIEHDYTMGFADAIGYRAGTTTPFIWYDLVEEKASKLWIHPFVAMEVTLKKYSQQSSQNAQTELLALQQFCKEHQLRFSTLWHNSSFSEAHGWAGWKEIYKALF